MLKRKLLRDIRGSLGAYIALISVLVIGLMLYVSMALTLDSLVISKDNYYRDYQLADGFARITRGPAGLVADLEDIRGIDKAVGRIVLDVLVNKPAGEETTTIRLVSFEERQPLNRFKLEQGKVPTGEVREILVTPAFLKGNNYQIGDQIPLIIKGREVRFTISGTANSPEYVYEIPNGFTLAPNPKAFGIALVPYSAIGPVLDMEGQVNDIAFSLNKGTEFLDVKTQASRVLNSYGMTSIYPVKDQLSYSMLSQEITGLEGSAKTSPMIFLLVAASVLYIMLRRMVEQQRGQIGVMKAFGFTDWEIINHYMGYALFIGTLGGLGGSVVGTVLSYYWVELYKVYYNIPDFTARVSLTYLLVGTLLSLLFSLFAGWRGCRRVMALSPAEALRPPAPPAGKKTMVERVRFLWGVLNTQAKMVVRNVFRNKPRAFLVILGVSCSFAMMVSSRASFDSTYYLIRYQFGEVERYDIKVTLNQYIDRVKGVNDSRNIDGVAGAEPMLEVPVTLSNRWLQKDIVITGLPQNSRLYRLVSAEGKHIDLPDNGLVISNQLAKTLEIQPGEVVTIKPFLGDRREEKVVVRQVVPQYVGLGAYMDIDALGALIHEPSSTSSILLSVDRSEMDQVRKDLQEGRNVGVIYDKNRMKQQFEDLMESYNATQYILIFFAFITGFAIVYNVNIISLSERERELSTLMVLGMTEREVARILAFEQGFLGLVAVIVGIPLGYGMLYAIVNGTASDIYNMPLRIEPVSFLISSLGAAAFLVAAQWRIKGRIAKLSMIEVLKENE
ncbi:MAG: ABC transporter permease [Eubacteriales bacterium]